MKKIFFIFPLIFFALFSFFFTNYAFAQRVITPSFVRPLPSCKKVIDYINFKFNYNCSINPTIKIVTNTWRFNHYNISLVLDLPSSYEDEVEKITCLHNWKGINNCEVSKTSISTIANLKWNTSSKISYNTNEDISNEKRKLEVKEFNTNQKFVLEYTIPKPIYSTESFAFPVENPYSVTQRYGKTQYSQFHSGIDITSRNLEVKAVNNGNVLYSGRDIFSSECNNGGKIVKIQHSNGLFSAYFHLSKIFAQTGNDVKKGQTIGLIGNTGANECLPIKTHLHFEIRNGISQKNSLNPLLFY